MSNTTKLILLDSLLQEDRVLTPQGPSSISAVAELVMTNYSKIPEDRPYKVYSIVETVQRFLSSQNFGRLKPPSPLRSVSRLVCQSVGLSVGQSVSL